MLNVWQLGRKFCLFSYVRTSTDLNGEEIGYSVGFSEN